MSKVAIVVLAEKGSHAGIGRVVNDMEFAKELHEKNGDVTLIFDGAGVTFIPELEKDADDANSLYELFKPVIEGACKFCSKAFGVINEVRKTDLELLKDYDDHPSLRTYLSGWLSNCDVLSMVLRDH